MGQQFMLWLGCGSGHRRCLGRDDRRGRRRGRGYRIASDSGGASSSESAQSNGSKADSPSAGSAPSSGGALNRIRVRTPARLRPSRPNPVRVKGIRVPADPSRSSGRRAVRGPRLKRRCGGRVHGHDEGQDRRNGAGPPKEALRRKHHRAVRDQLVPPADKEARAVDRIGDGPVRHQGASCGRDRRRRLGGPADARRTGQGEVGTGNRGCVVDDFAGHRDANDSGAIRRGGQGLGRRTPAAVGNQPDRVRRLQSLRGGGRDSSQGRRFSPRAAR